VSPLWKIDNVYINSILSNVVKVSLRRSYSFTLDEVKDKLDLKGKIIQINGHVKNTGDTNSPDYNKLNEVRVVVFAPAVLSVSVTI